MIALADSSLVATPGLVIEGGQSAVLALVLARTTGFVVTAPILGHRRVPSMVKAGLAAVLAVAVVGRTDVARGALPLALAFPLELAVGLALGALLAIGFATLEIIGRLVSLQMGLSLGTVLGPNESEAGTVLDPLFAILGALVFLGLDLHMALVAVLDQSLRTLPLGGGWPLGLASLVVGATTLVIDLGVRIAMPLSLGLLLVELAVALVARAIPQVNVFFLGLPLKILVGMVALAAALPAIAAGASGLFRTLFQVATGGTPP